VVTSCHNCVDGLADLIKHYKLPMKVTQLVNLVANALVIEKVEEKAEKVPEVAAELPLSGYKILVVDDEPDVREFISTVLEDNGASVTLAVDGEEALEKARSIKPHMMTLDLSMPGTDGVKVYEQLRADAELKGIKVCIVTGKPELRKFLYSRETAKPEGYLDKPISEESLLVSVRKVLEISRDEEQ
jgi:CheY-like chemotaxis protein